MSNNCIIIPHQSVDDPFYNNVALLMHGQGVNGSTTFTDKKGHALTNVGSPTISTAQSKFGTSSISLNGSSRLTHAAANEFKFGTGDFTMETWVRQTSRPALANLLTLSNAGTSTGIVLQINASGFLCASTALSQYLTSNVNAIALNTWTHVALSRVNGTSRLFVDGVLVASAADSLNLTDGALTIGAFADASGPFTGFLQEIRITKGVGRYTATFSPPTAPFPDNPPDPFFNNVTLLSQMDGANGASIFTNAKGPAYSMVGAVTTSTAQFKYGSASASFPGGANYLAQPASNDWVFPGDFTLEMWVRPTAPTAATQFLLSNRIANAADQWCISLFSTTGRIDVKFSGDSTPNITPALALTANTWYHIALVRQGNNCYLFINGKLEGTTTFSGTMGAADKQVGLGAAGNGQFPFTGFIDGVRITKGVARYTADFVPPGEFPNF